MTAPASTAATPEATLRRIAELEARLREAEDTLEAIRSGEVDAVIAGGPGGHQVYTLESADRPYRVLIEQMQEGAVTLAPDGTILYCNRRFASLVDTSPGRVTGHSIYEFLPDRERATFDALLGESAEGGGSGELALRTANGTLIPVYLSLVDLPSDSGRVICGILTDLTLQMQRRVAEESLQIALEASEMGSWDLDLVRDTARRSARHDQIFGHEELLPEWGEAVFMGYVLPEDREAVSASFERAIQSGILQFECRIRRASDAATRWIRVKGRTYYDSGKPVRMAGVIADITEQRHLEDQLRQAQKMEAVGQLTGGVAHDFNNLLTVILGNLTRAQLHAKDEKLARQIDHARQAAEKGAGLTQQLLAFSRRQNLQSRVICVNDSLPGLRLLVERAVGEEIELRLIKGEGLWHCCTDPNQLEAAILNLAINARDAMPRGGQLTIETANVDVSDDDAAALPGLSPGRYVRITVADTGEGMSAEVQSRVFEPFFTTKEVGKGSGLGLSMVYGFARQSNGHVAIDSKVGCGTAVHLYLPWAEPVADADESLGEPRSPQSQPVRILIAEDDPDVRQLVVELMSDLGHSVVEAGSGPEALAVLERQADIELLFTDVVMPKGMSGIELAREARRRRPDLAILLTSGFTTESLTHEEGSEREFPFIRKPYRREQLAEAVDAAMAEARAKGAEDPGRAPRKADKRSVLVVEDDALVAMMLEDFLEELGYAIVGPVGKLEAALETAQSGRFDVALLDVNLGDKEGYAVADVLIERDIPFAFTTGHGAGRLPEAYRDCAQLSKPYGKAAVAQILESLIDV